MHLIIDIGNTKIKYHLFQSGEIINNGTVETMNELHQKIRHHLDEKLSVLYSDVSGLFNTEKLRNYFPHQRIFSLKSLNYPFEMSYLTPETLGDDRIGLVAAALKKIPREKLFDN